MNNKRLLNGMFNQHITMQDTTEFPNLIVIHPFGRGGSVFFQSLFDGHPNITTLPSFGSIYSNISEEIIAEQNIFNKEVEKFISKNQNIFDTSKGYFGKGKGYTSGLFGQNANEHIVTDINIFKKKINELKTRYFNDKKPILRKFFFILVHLSFYEIYFGKCNNIKYLLYHPHNIFELRCLIKDFPDLYFIGMSRNPLGDWNSWKKVLSIRINVKIQKINILHAFNNIFNYCRDVYLFILIKDKINNKKIIDLIYLHSQNINLMKKICIWLKVDFNENLLVSTFCNKVWAGNYANRSIKSSFDSNRKDSTNELSNFEKDFVISKTLLAANFLNYKITKKGFSYYTKIRFYLSDKLINFYQSKNSLNYIIKKEKNSIINKENSFKLIKIYAYNLTINFMFFLIKNLTQKKIKKIKNYNSVILRKKLKEDVFFI